MLCNSKFVYRAHLKQHDLNQSAVQSNAMMKPIQNTKTENYGNKLLSSGHMYLNTMKMQEKK